MFQKIANILSIVSFVMVASMSGGTYFAYKYVTSEQFQTKMMNKVLRNVQGRRGIFDFKVVCNESNNTPEIIDTNSFVADIFIKPARSINFITLNFIATRTGVSFEEIGG